MKWVAIPASTATIKFPQNLTCTVPDRVPNPEERCRSFGMMVSLCCPGAGSSQRARADRHPDFPAPLPVTWPECPEIGHCGSSYTRGTGQMLVIWASAPAPGTTGDCCEYRHRKASPRPASGSMSLPEPLSHLLLPCFHFSWSGKARASIPSTQGLITHHIPQPPGQSCLEPGPEVGKISRSSS